jgi:hypothetical protein
MIEGQLYRIGFYSEYYDLNIFKVFHDKFNDAGSPAPLTFFMYQQNTGQGAYIYMSLTTNGIGFYPNSVAPPFNSEAFGATGGTGTLLRCLYHSSVNYFASTTGLFYNAGKGGIQQMFANTGMTGDGGYFKTSQGTYMWMGTSTGMYYCNVNQAGATWQQINLGAPAKSFHLYSNGMAIVSTTNGMWQLTNINVNLLSYTGTPIASGDYSNMIFPSSFATPIFYGASGVVMRDANFNLGVISSIAMHDAGTNSTGTAVQFYGDNDMYQMTTEDYTVSSSLLEQSLIQGSFQYSDGSTILATTTNFLQIYSTGGEGAENPLTWGWTRVPFSLIDDSEIQITGNGTLKSWTAAQNELNTSFAHIARNLFIGLTNGADFDSVMWDLLFITTLADTQQLSFGAYGTNGSQAIVIAQSSVGLANLNMFYVSPTGDTTYLIQNGVLQPEIDEQWASPPGILSYQTGTYVEGMCYSKVDVSELLLWLGQFFTLDTEVKNNPAGAANIIQMINGLSRRITPLENYPVITNSTDYANLSFGSIFIDGRQ